MHTYRKHDTARMPRDPFFTTLCRIPSSTWSSAMRSRPTNTHIYVYIHMYIHTYIHTANMNTYIYTCIHTANMIQHACLEILSSQHYAGSPLVHGLRPCDQVPWRHEALIESCEILPIRAHEIPVYVGVCVYSCVFKNHRGTRP